MNREIKNAEIESTMLGYEDHGILTCFLHLNYGGSGQGFGGYGLDAYDKASDTRKGTAYGIAFIRHILDVLEVSTWEELKGKYCRADASFGKVYGVGHLLKDKWFYPEKDLVEYIQEAKQ